MNVCIIHLKTKLFLWEYKEKILNFINSITTISDKTMLSMISNIQLEDEDLFDTNLSFADKNTAIEEELSIYELLNK